MDRWLAISLMSVFAGVFLYSINTWYDRQTTSQIQSNQDYIINEINQSSAERDENLKMILTSLNQTAQETKQDAAANRLILESIIKEQNITVIVEEGNKTDGKISSILTGPRIINLTK